MPRLQPYLLSFLGLVSLRKNIVFLEMMPSLPGHVYEWNMFRTVFKNVRRPGRVQLRQLAGSTNPHIVVSEEVREAVQHGRPVVALESTIYTHGTCALV